MVALSRLILLKSQWVVVSAEWHLHEEMSDSEADSSLLLDNHRIPSVSLAARPSSPFLVSVTSFQGGRGSSS